MRSSSPPSPPAPAPALLGRPRGADPHHRRVRPDVGRLGRGRRRRRPLPRPPPPPSSSSTCAPTSAPTRGSACSTWSPSSPTRPAAPRQPTSRRLSRCVTTSPGGSPRPWVCRSFLYGPLPGGRIRSLPEVRRHAFAATAGLRPDFGPARPDPSAGATAGGARRVLVAYNVWVSSLAVARVVVPLVRGPVVRALALAVGARAQVSCNLIEPDLAGPRRSSTTGCASWRPRRAGPWTGPSSSASCPRRCWPRCPGPAGPSWGSATRRRWSPGWPRPSAPDRSEGPSTLKVVALGSADDVAASRRKPEARHEAAAFPLRSCRPRCRELLAVGEGVLSRQSSRTTHAAAEPPCPLGVGAPRSGKNRSGSTPMQFACICQLRSWPTVEAWS